MEEREKERFRELRLRKEGEKERRKERNRPPQSKERRTEEGEIKKVEKERERPPHSEHQREGCSSQRLFLSQHSSRWTNTEAVVAFTAKLSLSLPSYVCVCAYSLMTGALTTPVNCGCAQVIAFNREKLENYIIWDDATCACVYVCVRMSTESHLL